MNAIDHSLNTIFNEVIISIRECKDHAQTLQQRTETGSNDIQNFLFKLPGFFNDTIKNIEELQENVKFLIQFQQNFGKEHDELLKNVENVFNK